MIKINGGQFIDYMWCKNKVLTDEEISDITSSDSQKPVWSENTTALALFENNINASNVKGLEQEILGYRIFRKNVNETTLVKVAEVDSSVRQVQDFIAANNNEFQYYIFHILNDNGVKILSSPLVSNVIRTDWWSWSVVGTKATNTDNVYEVDTDNIWRFSLNVSSGERKQNLDKTLYNNVGTYSKVNSYKKNYITSQLSCLLGNVSCESRKYLDIAEMIEKWEDFVNNGEIKIIKDRKGTVMPIEIMESSIQYMDDLMEQPSQLTFSYVQLNNAKNISVYGMVT